MKEREYSVTEGWERKCDYDGNNNNNNNKTKLTMPTTLLQPT